MQLSWLLGYSILMVAATREALTYSQGEELRSVVASTTVGQDSMSRKVVLHEAVTPGVIEEQIGAERLSAGVAGRKSEPAAGKSLALRLPRPTATPLLRKRQDDGQIQALSSQLQSLSQSATQAISSVSSSASSMLSLISQSAQSVRQSADQATQSANQAADQANRELSQTRSSASSAVSSANARASDQISQSLASMSSRISANQASAESSASVAISSARVAASQFAASQIQAAQEGATGVTDSTNPQMNQPQPISVSTTNLAIIIVVAIIGTAILSTACSCFWLRYRQRRRSSRSKEVQGVKEEKYVKPIAVRGSLNPHFPRFGGSFKSPAKEFRLPSFSPQIQSKKAQREEWGNIGSAVSDYSDQAENRVSGRRAEKAEEVQPQAFRLQKGNGVNNATTVRLIRVNSEKSKAESSTGIQQSAAEPMPPPPILNTPDRTPEIPAIPASSQSSPRGQPQTSTSISQPPDDKGPPSGGRVSSRSTRILDTETPGWRPPTISTKANRNRFRFRDSSDMESAEPTPTDVQGQASSGRDNSYTRASLGQPKNAGGTFATFPRTRNESQRESMMNRGRPNLDGRAARLG
ncbi:hypothetical protein F5B22DRAFT_77548 [Xylaria bambusicola]|uniref:uncharacterized protein n=1 Tax=Xylaria bambusicola TaxID=326684 RepID=UPI002008006C|nr:uncharacterized protein F5B22DRAFT_77548 [Xylaria bambusicola]KAI0518232.1 hypothetical protein F5B22DRAFT_77548 [Xylaria bambusicola]